MIQLETHVFLFIVFPQVLSELDIVVPLQLLISMFSDGVNSVKELANQRKSRVSELAGNLAARRVTVIYPAYFFLLMTVFLRESTWRIKNPLMATFD